MSEISRRALFGKLNSLAYKAIEGATVFCKLRGNPYVELVHWIQQILQTPDSDLHRIVRHFEIDSSRLAKDVTDALDRLPRGATLDLGSVVARRECRRARLGLRDADVRRAAVRTGHLIVGMLKTPSLRNALIGDLAPVRAHQARHADRRLRADRRTARRKTRSAPPTARRWRRRARPATRWRRRRWASRKRSSALRRT